ncbi:MAG TPA: DUF2807 domain-containing protein [Bacteroidetes bacterium]|nr:DUF2807 domain-containing protein [Bacteroidota bacterium]
MKTRIYSLTFLLLLVLFTSGCDRGTFCEKGKGELVTQELTLSSFTGFDNTIAADIVLTQGETQSVSITAQQNIIDKLKTNVSGDVWTIDFKGCVRTKSDVKIEITVPNLTLVGISGSGRVTATNRFTELGDVVLDISGSGHIALDMDANDVTIKISGSGSIEQGLRANVVSSKISGSGNIELSGTCNDHSYRVAGSGDLHAFELETRNSTVKIAGSGNAEVRASESLNVSISGAGNVSYKGTPTIDVNISGSGNLINAN